MENTEKVSITVTFDAWKLEAMEHYLEKENSSVKKKLTETADEMYEKFVPAEVREFLDSRLKPKRVRHSTPAKPSAVPPKADSTEAPREEK